MAELLENCGSFLDEDEDGTEHYCCLGEGHDEDHECDCGVTW